MIILCSIIFTIIAGIVSFCIYQKNFIRYSLYYFIGSILIGLLIFVIDVEIQITDTEIWSGRITEVKHIEEYDKKVQVKHEDEDGDVYYTTKTEHHDAENFIYTSDGGKIKVKHDLNNNIKFTDKYPNNNQELMQYYSIGSPTSSIHTYKNKVQSSYSIYKHNEIDITKYALPNYPCKLYDYIHIDRFLGEIDNKEDILKILDEINADLNSKEKNKQVNIIYVNLGNVTIDYGYALQDYWEGGNKNDFIISFGMNNNEILWCYPFSWADSQKSELLKIQVRNYILKQKEIIDFEPIIKEIGKMIEQNFERKEFADFNYLQVETTKCAWVIIIVINIIGLLLLIFKNKIF